MKSKLLAFFLIGLFISPNIALAVTQPVSAPVSIPVIIPNPSPVGIGATNYNHPPSPVPSPSPSPSASPSATPKPVPTPAPTPKTVDLVVTAISTVATPQIGGQPVVLNVTVKNTGNADAILANKFDNFYLYVLLRRNSDNKVINTSPYFFINIQSIKAGETKNYIVTSENITAAGKYNFSAQVDPLNQIKESNEANNTLTYSFGVINPAPKISSITPNSGNVGDIITVNGSNFGNQSGQVVFYNSRDQAVSAAILGWYDGGIKFRVPAVAKATYAIAVKTADGRESDKVSFSVIAAKPTISSTYPYTLRVGNYIYIYGQNLGTSGKVNFYLPNQTAASGSLINYYWSDGLIFGQIPSYLKSNTQYGIQVRTSDGRDSSLIYRYISK